MHEKLKQSITWRETGNATFPWEAHMGNETYVVRLNDFPAEPLYTLIVNGTEFGDFEDWPATWKRPR